MSAEPGPGAAGSIDTGSADTGSVGTGSAGTGSAGTGPVIGILGGMGPAATADFFRRIVEATPAARDQDHLHLVIDNDPSVPDRTAALLDGGADPTPTLLAMARRLAGAGADLLVAPCNTASAFLDPVAVAVGVPLLRWNAAVVSRLARRLPPGCAVGILATSGTARTGLYQGAMEAAGLRPLLPDDGLQHRVMEMITARKAGRHRHQLADDLAAAVDAMRARGAGEVLLACTELSDIFSATPDLACIDAMDLVVDRLGELVDLWKVRGAGTPWPPTSGDIAAGPRPQRR